MEFEYKRYTLADGKTISRSVIPIPILIRNARNNEAIAYEALIDSGADRCVFPSEIGELIGIDIEAGEQHFVTEVVQGAHRVIYMHRVEITPGGYWASRNLHLMAGFMPDLVESGHGLLGQNGFFNNISFVKFRGLKGIVEIGARR